VSQQIVVMYNKSYILGSTSPRRKEILAHTGMQFEVVSPDFDEESVIFDGVPDEYVARISDGKWRSLAEKYPDQRIICADTAVFIDNQVLNKPASKAEAFAMLSSLQGRSHLVKTGMTLGSAEHHVFGVATTEVHFVPLTAVQIEAYLNSVHVLDKAGAYTIQGLGSLLVAKIVGCYDTVLGMPLQLLNQLMKKLESDLWVHIGQ